MQLSRAAVAAYAGTNDSVNRTFNTSNTMSLQRLAALRALMASQPTALAAYIVPTADAHNSEYIAPVDARREWLSGFTGSAGTAVVTPSHALLWTDGRYYTQFQKEADLALWTLMKQSLPETLSMEKWLVKNLVEGAVVGADPHTMTREEWTPLQTALSKANMQLVAVPTNLVDAARAQMGPAPPPRPRNPIIPLSVKYTGKTAGQKIEELRSKMAEKKAAALVITALDEIAYTLNLRGSDIEYNPVFFSYLVITATAADLFWGDGVLTEEVKGHLKWEGVELNGKPYEDIVGHLVAMARELAESGDCASSVWLSSDASEAIHRAAAGGDGVKTPLCLISEVSPVALAKLIKNDVELEGFRNCHVRDGIAVTRFFRWLHHQLDAGVAVTETQAADKLLEFRKLVQNEVLRIENKNEGQNTTNGTYHAKHGVESTRDHGHCNVVETSRNESDFMGPSFETIAGAGPNGAIIHYAPARDSSALIKRDEMFLLDSGGQYRDGTTDITRTRHMSGGATPAQKDAFTRVLKGQISVGSALFPQGVKGNVLDSFARKALWDVGLDYAHGTGHGVGHFLNVHEGPSGVSWRPYPHDPGLKPGQILSNEPGYYKVGEYGIRHEDLVEIVAVTKDSPHPRVRVNSDSGGAEDFEPTVPVTDALRSCPAADEEFSVHLLWSKLDKATKEQFELEHNSDGVPDFDVLGQFIEKRRRALENVGTISPPANIPTPAGNKRILNIKRLSWPLLCHARAHSVKRCRSKQRCEHCRYSHHTLLHFHKPEQPSIMNKSAGAADEAIAMVAGPATGPTLFATAVVLVTDRTGKRVPVRVLLDCASACNFISEQCVNRLGLKASKAKHIVSGIGQALAEPSGTLSCTISSNTDEHNSTFSFEAYVLPTICSDMPTGHIKPSSWLTNRDLAFADPCWNEPGPIDMLLGVDVFASSLRPGLIQGDPGQPRLSKPYSVGS
ncbi:hypothetical protein MSG28_015950 [Choristoneura fumiferana]|uniref:Uncharacterized protein n=1 Tax=Choristoneura fumiferana TaxID=7141 RepID=A0ACC0K5A1_CHOFU|nr:hypothetical protein MSG28_015950 [Choristoneura fumiferana]